MNRQITKATIVVFAVIGFCQTALAGALPGTQLTIEQTALVSGALQLIQSHGILSDSQLGQTLLKQGLWRAATPDDIYIAGAEKAGDTPYAYTLSSGRKPTAIVLAARFFTQATPLGRAALIIHELGHYKAYVRTGNSTEYDGYKEEYDNYPKLGLSEKDGLVFFSMLDGAAEYVVPRDKRYSKRPDLQQFLTN